MNALSESEQTNVRAAVEYLYVRCGTWSLLAKALGFKLGTVQHVMKLREQVSPSMAIRVARLADATIDDVLSGKWPAPGACPHCGQNPAVAARRIARVRARSGGAAAR